MTSIPKLKAERKKLKLEMAFQAKLIRWTTIILGLILLIIIIRIGV